MIKQNDLLRAHEMFREYLTQFDRSNPKIKLKMIHTMGVVDCAREIASRIGLSEEDRYLAELIALLHDIGRFEQAKQFDSFERCTMDHAAFGVELLFEQNMIRKFLADSSYDDLIRESIARHSDYALPMGLDPHTALHAKLIRDADKLDNCRVKIEDSVEVLLGIPLEELGCQPITEPVWQYCLARKSVLLKERQTKMDYWVSYLAYFFDINFKETWQIIEEKQYVDRIIDRVPYTNPETIERMQHLRDMLTERADSVH